MNGSSIVEKGGSPLQTSEDDLTPRNVSASKGSSQVPKRRRTFLIVVLAIVAVVVVLGLALGLGLGLGLRNRNNSSSNSPANLQTQDSSTFVLNGLKGQAPQTRVYNFTITEVTGAPDGVTKPMLVVNGLYPGPTIEANVNDRIVVNVQNNIQNATLLYPDVGPSLDVQSAIHWHGLYQNGTNFYDGTNAITQCGIPPGQSLTYNFTLNGWTGTTWWHAHSTQYTDGISGALVVHGENETVPSYDGSDVVVQMSDLYHLFSTIWLQEYPSDFGIGGTPGNEPVPDTATINGLGQYTASGTGGSYSNFTLSANKTHRLRLINTGSFAPVRFSVDSHVLTVIEADGVAVEPYQVTGINIAVAQRYSVLVTTNQTSAQAFWMRATMQTDMFKYDNPGLNANALAVFRYSTASANSMPDPSLAGQDPGVGSGHPNITDLDTSLLVPADRIDAPNATRQYPVTVSFQNTAQNAFLSFFNSTSWSPLPSGQSVLISPAITPQTLLSPTIGPAIYDNAQLIVTEDSIQTVDLIVNNLDDGDHPFHLHGHRPWIMGMGAGRYTGQFLNATNPMRRDTILIPAYNYAVLRFVTDNPGFWAFHCHLVWHMAAGLLMQVSSLPSVASQFQIPQVMKDQCATLLAAGDQNKGGLKSNGRR